MHETGDRAVHQRGMSGMYRLKAEAKTVHRARTKILDQHIRRCDQAPEHLFSGWSANINSDPVLVAVHCDKRRRLAVIIRWGHAPRIVSTTRILDFNHLGS